MYSTPIVNNNFSKLTAIKEKKMYNSLHITTDKSFCYDKRSEMVALFMDTCSIHSGSCVQSRLLGPSDTYSTVSSGCRQSSSFNPMSNSTSFTSSAQSQWVLPPYTAIDQHYVNVPVYKPTTVQITKVQRSSRRSVWLGLIFGFSIFLVLVLGAVIAYGLQHGML